MPALKPGTPAPDFTLQSTDGNPFRLADALAKGRVVLAFFKVTCPVCQYAFPLYDRVYRAHKNGNVTFVGVSQNEEEQAEQFMRQYSVSFPVVLDDPSKYAVSNAYGITHVPTFFLISPEGTIEMASVSWSRLDVEELHRRLTDHDGNRARLFEPGEHVVDFRAG